MPEAEVLADVKGPRVSPDSVLAGMGINGPGSQALEFWSRRTAKITVAGAVTFQLPTGQPPAPVHFYRYQCF